MLTGSRPAVPTVSFFLTAEDEENESNDFDRFILEAILSDCEKTYDAVMLAVLWGDQATIRNQLDQSQTEDKKGLARALEQSLLRKDANVTRVLLEYNVEAKYVNMDRLFKELKEVENEEKGEDTEAKAEPAVRPARSLPPGLPHLLPRRTARASLAPIRSARVPLSLHRRQNTSCARPPAPQTIRPFACPIRLPPRPGPRRRAQAQCRVPREARDDLRHAFSQTGLHRERSRGEGDAQGYEVAQLAIRDGAVSAGSKMVVRWFCTTHYSDESSGKGGFGDFSMSTVAPGTSTP